MNKELVIDVTSSEIVIALLEDKQLVELNKEKSNTQFTVGDVYIGKVKKLMPGLNAAFVDVGFEKDAFLHYLDLGPQFKSLHKFLSLAISEKKELPTLHKFQPASDINKEGKISDILKTNQYVVVQITKEPISTKGPRLSSEISIAGRNLVLIPFSKKVSVSQKITSEEERDRLKSLVRSIKYNNYGVIIRTAAEGKKVADLDQELRELVQKWENEFRKLKEAIPPQLVIGELSRASAIVRDMLSDSFNNIHINNKDVYEDVKGYIRSITPEKEKIVKYVNGNTPIFDQFGIEKQIKALFGKTVTSKNGAYLIIEHTEALHVIDVNSGNRSKSENNQETNALEVNLVAATEIARQLRLRDMGGIIVVDFIDMHLIENRKLLYKRLKEAMDIDRAKHYILPLSKFGLMQITRQRVRPEMNIKTREKCPTCEGTGEISSTIIFIDELESNLKYVSEIVETKTLTLRVHPFIEAYITKGFNSILRKWKKKYHRKIKVQSITSYTLLNFKFFDQNDNEIIL